MKNKYYWYILLKNMFKYDITKKQKKVSDLKMSKKKIDQSKLFGKILAGVMAGLMLLSFCITLIYYLVKM